MRRLLTAVALLALASPLTAGEVATAKLDIVGLALEVDREVTTGADIPAQVQTRLGGKSGNDVPPNLMTVAADLTEPDAFDRQRSAVKNSARTLDIDLIVVGDKVSDTDELRLPHPRAAERAFVLKPWHDLEPDAMKSAQRRGARLLAFRHFRRIDQLLRRALNCKEQRDQRERDNQIHRSNLKTGIRSRRCGN